MLLCLLRITASRQTQKRGITGAHKSEDCCVLCSSTVELVSVERSVSHNSRDRQGFASYLEFWGGCIVCEVWGFCARLHGATSQRHSHLDSHLQTYLLTYLIMYLFIYLLTYLLTYLLIYFLTSLCTYLSTCLLIYFLISLIMYLFIYLLTYLLRCLFTYLFT